MNHRILGVVSFGLTLLSSEAPADYFTNFDGAPFQEGFSISQFIDLGNGTYREVDPPFAVTSSPHDWVTTDASEGDSVIQVTGFREYAGDRSAIVGGLVGLTPSSTNIELWEPLIQGNFTFIVKFSITPSDVSRPANDTFSWTFRNTVGDLLFQIRFDPKTTGFQPDPVHKLDVNWVDSNLNVHPPDDLSKSVIIRNTTYILRVDANFQVGIFTAFVTEPVTNRQVTLTGIMPLGGSLGRAAATWQLDSNSVMNYGSNSMVFDNYTVSTSGSVILPPVKIARQSGGGILLSWYYPPTLAPGVMFSLESRAGLATLPAWTPLVATITKPTSNPGVFQALLPADLAPARFYRLRVTYP